MPEPVTNKSYGTGKGTKTSGSVEITKSVESTFVTDSLNSSRHVNSVTELTTPSKSSYGVAVNNDGTDSKLRLKNA